jgi:hypothetical protein
MALRICLFKSAMLQLANTSATLTLHELNSGEVLTGEVDISKLSSKRYWELVLGGGNLNSSTITLPLADEE